MDEKKKLELKAKLEKLAENCRDMSGDEPFNPYDTFGGNMDDAYYGGFDDGQADLAQSILDEFFNK